MNNNFDKSEKKISSLESRLRNGENIKLPLGNDLCEITWKESINGTKMFHVLFNQELVSLSLGFKTCQMKVKSLIAEIRLIN
jgi:hypothetical protein